VADGLAALEQALSIHALVKENPDSSTARAPLDPAALLQVRVAPGVCQALHRMLSTHNCSSHLPVMCIRNMSSSRNSLSYSPCRRLLGVHQQQATHGQLLGT
jgi:hypothetical protein